ncbi:MAG: LysR substrate-binding domain-containing protein [Rhodospirillales bacterium]|nr:LysR substrate-binding domain-containing protein [Rhodospirillales bacterium]
MKITQLKYALMVAQEKNFSRAADMCNVSQPSLSVAIKNLEEELDVTIFERIKNEIKITDDGQKILFQASKAISEIEQIKEVANSVHGELSGTLNLGAIYSIGPYIFPNLIPQIHNLAPNLTLLIEENFTSTLLEFLAHGKVDIALVALPFDQPGMTTIPLYKEPFVATIPKGHPWEGRDDIAGDELASEKLLLLGKGHCFREQVLEICEFPHEFDDNSNGVHNIIEGNSLETIRHMVAVGTGITVLPTSALENFLCTAERSCPRASSQTLRYAFFKDPAPSRTIALAFRTSYPNTQSINLLKNTIQKNLPNGCLQI